VTVRILHGDCLKLLPLLPANSFDAVCCDPPYHLTSITDRFGKEGSAPAKHGTDGAFARASAGFMGQKWDGGDVAFRPETWAEVFRVLKPGAHVAAFGGTRTFHRMAVAIEDAGFEIRDTLSWLYGCLDEQTEAATASGVKPYHKIMDGDLVLCYDPETAEYSYQPVLEVVVYDYNDTAYRIIGDFGEQIVSRNHRCIVERGGDEVFQFAEEAAREREARVPVLEDLYELQQAVSNAYQRASGSEQSVRPGVLSSVDGRCPFGEAQTSRREERTDGPLCGVRDSGVALLQSSKADASHNLRIPVQRRDSWCGLGSAREQGSCELEAREQSCSCGSHDRRCKPGLEGRSNVPQPEGSVCGSADQVCSLSGSLSHDGAQGWLCDGASACGGTSDRSAVAQSRGSASSEPSCDGECTGEFDAVRHERAAQGVRAWRGHHTAVVRIVPFHYTGKVWCLRVPTGAFVAVRGGVAFPTGNSGFPKSHDVSKGIDKSLGAKGTEAKEWQGFGTALKPGWEPIILARKPLTGTVAENVLAFRTGGINIDACRVETAETITTTRNVALGSSGSGIYGSASTPGIYKQHDAGRFPANVMHDGSDEVLEAFAAYGMKGAAAPVRGTEPSLPAKGDVVYGFCRRVPAAFHADTGTAARFFYSAKASKADRAGSKHPTVKPISLMQWLCRLITPPGGTILDPFAGSGTTGAAAQLEGFNSVLIEQSAEYVEDIKRRFSKAA
jgi:DNA modification methylase